MWGKDATQARPARPPVGTAPVEDDGIGVVASDLNVEDVVVAHDAPGLSGRPVLGFKASMAAMTLDVYGHLFPDTEDATRVALDGVL
jgi:hypothetical protein